MAKKVAHIIIALLLLISTSGVAVTKHYCGNNLRSVAILTQPASCCDDQGCCHNETEIFRVHSEFAISATSFEFEQLLMDEPPVYEVFADKISEIATENIYSDRPSPPLLRDILASFQTFIL